MSCYLPIGEHPGPTRVHVEQPEERTVCYAVHVLLNVWLSSLVRNQNIESVEVIITFKDLCRYR